MHGSRSEVVDLPFLTGDAFIFHQLSDRQQHAVNGIYFQRLATEQKSPVVPCRDTTSRSGVGLSGTVYRQGAGSAVTGARWTRGSAAPIIVALGFLSAAVSAVAPFSWVSHLVADDVVSICFVSCLSCLS